MLVPVESLLGTLQFKEIFTVLMAALGCGLLMGLERERNKANGFAGLRSFALSSLFGALCFSFGMEIGIVGALLVGGLCFFSSWSQRDDIGITTELAFMMTYFIGAICWWNIPVSASVSVVLTIILMAKQRLHGIASKWITDAELRDGILLLALILIALPLTPNTSLWGPVLNPYLILKLLVLLLGIQALAHLASRLLSSQKALILSALASGFVSSTATIASLGMQVRSENANPRLHAGAALMSCISTMLQLLIIVAGISLAWLKLIIIPSVVSSLILLGYALWLLRTTGQENTNALEKKTSSTMFSLKVAGIIAAALTLIQAGVYGLTLLLGDAGLVAGTLLASLFEIHAAIAAVIVQGEPTGAQANVLAFSFMGGMLIHAIAKSINSALTGGKAYARDFIPVQIIHMLVFVILMWWSFSHMG